MPDLFLSDKLHVNGKLGLRFPGHDERNRGYGVRPLLGAVERKPTFWPLPEQNTGFPLDQGKEGACGAFSGTHELAVGPIYVPGMTEQFALDFYRRIQATDRAMGNNWPDGVSMLALGNTLRAEGRITGYRWAFGIDDVVDTLCSTGPIILGVEWRYNMYFTGSGGRVHVTGNVVGGHALTAVAYDVHPVWGPVVGWLNSWGKGYGVSDPRLRAPGGIGWITVPDLAALLSRQGEALVPSDFFVDAPVVRDPANAPFFATRTGSTFHDRHPFLRRDRVFWNRNDAISAGLNACKVCKP
jgi:hypothetical protein